MTPQPSIFLNNISIHESWAEFFAKSEVQQELQTIETKIQGKPFTPKCEQVLRFATMDLSLICIIIFGKDVYAKQKSNGEFVATGRAFEVSGATSWFDKEINPSLKNIVKLIHKMYFDNKVALPIQKVRNDIEIGLFPIPTPDKAFDYWEEQGVLWLNTAFTCEVGGIQQAGSHLKVWKTFFQWLLVYIAEKNQSIRYFLWGDAKKYGKRLRQLGVQDIFLYESKHPCTNGDLGGYKRDSTFLMNPCFYDTQSFLRWTYTKE